MQSEKVGRILIRLSKIEEHPAILATHCHELMRLVRSLKAQHNNQKCQWCFSNYCTSLNQDTEYSSYCSTSNTHTGKLPYTINSKGLKHILFK